MRTFITNTIIALAALILIEFMFADIKPISNNKLTVLFHATPVIPMIVTSSFK